MIVRRKCKEVAVGNIRIGGNAPISVQSMLNVPAEDIEKSISQAKELENAGCDIIRLAVPNAKALKTLNVVKDKVSVPVVADIHFDYRLAIESISAGADKIRINPGNIGSEDRIKAVAQKCLQNGIPVRIGVNSGSIEKNILAKHGTPSADAMVESALYHISLFNKYDFDNLIISLKASDAEKTVSAYEILAQKCDYPLHIGVTEAGTLRMGVIKSAVAFGALLMNGIGDTIRVSLTAPPVQEVLAGISILKAVGLRHQGIEFISCPTCGRTKIDLIELAKQIESRLLSCEKNIKVAIMGCVVNGPGEAREADIGIAGGDGCAVIFKKGEILRKVNEEYIIDELIAEIEKL